MRAWYILDENRNPVVVEDFLVAVKWLQDARHRRVKEEYWYIMRAKRVEWFRISTVFLGLDHGFGRGAPILFETMIFGGPYDKYQERCSTWDEACAMHKNVRQLATDFTAKSHRILGFCELNHEFEYCSHAPEGLVFKPDAPSPSRRRRNRGRSRSPDRYPSIF